MASERPDMTVVVVTHNGRELALSTLDSALAHQGGVNAEWWVVDAGSTDGTPDEIERRYPDMTVSREANVGFAAANNVALRHARGRYVLLLNPDVEVLEGTLADLVAALDARPQVGAASVHVEGPDGRRLPYIKRFPSPLRQIGEALFLPRLLGLGEAREGDDAYATETPTDWLPGTFLAVRSEVIEQVGGLDERFFLYSEEVDWCLRMSRAGWEVRHLPLGRVCHFGGTRPRDDMAAQLSWSKVQYADKHFSRAAALSMRAAIALGHALRAAVLAPAALIGREGARVRLRTERGALRVVLGMDVPPFERLRPAQ